MNLADTVKAKSDRLNADDLIGGPITVPIKGYKLDKEGRLTVEIGGGHMPWKPPKTVIKLLIYGWGSDDTDNWPPEPWVTLYRDASVKFGGEALGGVRVSHMSHIREPFTLALAESRGGKKRPWTVKPLKQLRQSGAPTANLDRVLADNGLTRAHLDAWLTSVGAPIPDTPEREAECAAWIQDKTNDIRAFAEKE